MTELPPDEPANEPAVDTGGDSPDATPAPDVVEDQGDDTVDESDSPGAEAARYRRRLRGVEAERDSLAARVEALQRSHIDSLLAAEHITATAFWAVNDNVTELLADDGTPDPAKVKAAATTARETLGLQRGLHVPAKGRHQPSGSHRQFRDAFTPPTSR